MADLPALPAGLSSRPLSEVDLPAVAALLAAAEPVDDTGEHFLPDDLHEWWTGWGIDLARDALGVWAADGSLVGYGTVLASPTYRDAVRIHLEGRVHPARRGEGIGRALLGWQLTRGEELHGERHPGAPARLVVSVLQTLPALERLVRSAGLEAERWYRHMERPLTDPPAIPVLPGIELVGWTPERDDEVRRAHNASFTEHHGSSERDPQTWQRLYTGQRSFRPDLSALALADSVLVGYALGYVYGADSLVTGHDDVHLGQIGVLPPFRGRGVASAAIAAVLRAAADAGCRSAGLEVDSDNVTGAVGVYERLGFRTTRTQVSWSRALPAVAGG